MQHFIKGMKLFVLIMGAYAVPQLLIHSYIYSPSYSSPLLYQQPVPLVNKVAILPRALSYKVRSRQWCTTDKHQMPVKGTMVLV